MRTSEILTLLKKVRQIKPNVWTACCPAHDDKTPSMTVTEANDKTLVTCHAGCTFEAILAALNLKPSDLFAEPLEKMPPVQSRMVEFYEYHDATGNVVYRAERWEPGPDGKRKTFKQSSLIDGEWIKSMNGVERVLFNLPAVLASKEVWIVEGERKAQWLSRLGFVSTCNVGGAKNWLEAYADSLLEKDVIIWPDNDDAGKVHGKAIHDSLVGKAASVRFVRAPAPHNDCVDLLRAINDDVKACETINGMLEKATVLARGIDLPIYSMEILERQYIDLLRRSETHALDLSHWLPSFRQFVRKIIPGEVVLVMAETGVGKTAIAQNIAVKAAPMKTLLFELELPGTLTFERFLGLELDLSGDKIEEKYARGHVEDWTKRDMTRHVFTCPRSKLSPSELEKLIEHSSLIIGERPGLVIVDYVQLVKGGGTNRREKIADSAEEMKQIAKNTNTILLMTSQVSRKGEDAGGEVFLNDAKEAGEIENSSGLVMGAWRDADNGDMCIRVLKQTKGKPMKFPIRCRMSDSLRITEKMPERPAYVGEPR